MQVGVGYSDNPRSGVAGVEAAAEALERAGMGGRCDLVLLFATSAHDQDILKEAVLSVVGEGTPIYGGGAVGAITNDRFGYAGNQVVIACIVHRNSECVVLTEGKLSEGERLIGGRLGRKLAEKGVRPDSPVMLFYDAILPHEDGSGISLMMATHLLAGLENELGFLPDLTGAGLQADYSLSPSGQWIGDRIDDGQTIALLFGGDVRIDNIIMHGCRPATAYYTVTAADEQTILEINGEPALPFLERTLKHEVLRGDFPFFLILGVNKGEKWGEFDEDNYASRLCLGIDEERNGLVMFEPDMVAGTEFQIMFRSLELSYMKPRIERLFDNLGGRRPILAVYINCAGRAAGYAGIDMEDAVMMQNAIGDRAPLLGIYTGVEIAPVHGRPAGLDWTGVFCLFSIPE